MRQKLRRILIAIWLGYPHGAFAHAMLVKAVPAVGGTVAAAPSQIRITFSEAVEPRFSGIAIEGADGRAVATEPASLDATDHATLVVLLKERLQAGRYKVIWHAVSVDTHRTQGSFPFEVKPQ
jgi:methionine-rich copper-binding protein CopC